MRLSDKEIFIHVGMPKTGTTSLQKVLWRNRASLLDQYGVLYPDAWLDAEGIAQHGLRVSLCNEVGGIDNIVFQIEKYFEADAVGKIVISTESLSNVISSKDYPFFLELLVSLSRVGKVRIVICLREYSSFVESMYLHDVKVGIETVSFQKYLEDRLVWLDVFFKRLSLIRQLFESVDIVVLPHDGGSIISKFERLLNVDLEGADDRGNAKLSLKSQAILYRWGEFSELAGLDRNKAIYLLEKRSIVFEDDIFDYSLYDANEKRLLMLLSIEYARKWGFQDYIPLVNRALQAPLTECFSLSEVDFSDDDLCRIVDGCSV